MKTITEEIAKEMYNSGNESLKNFAKECYPELFNEQKKWEDFGEFNGYYIDNFSNIYYYSEKSSKSNRNTHPTSVEAQSALALIQLTQWRDKANGQPLHEWADWDDEGQDKYCIEIFNGKPTGEICSLIFHDLAFKNHQIRDQFMKDHKDLLEVWASKARKEIYK